MTSMRINQEGFLPPTMIMALIILVIAVALFVVGASKAGAGCFAAALYWMAAGAFVLGVDGSLSFQLPHGIVIGGGVGGVLALVGFVASLLGAC